MLCGVGLDDDHSLALYQWSQKRLIASGPSSKDKVLGLAFLSQPLAAAAAAAADGPLPAAPAPPNRGAHPPAPPPPKSGPCMDLVTCGVDHVKLWNPSGRSLSCQRGVFGGKPKATMLCVQDVGPLVVTGAASGAIYVWRGHRCDQPHFITCLDTGRRTGCFA